MFPLSYEIYISECFLNVQNIQIQFASQLVINPLKAQTHNDSLVWSLFKTCWRRVKREANHITLWGPSHLVLSSLEIQLWITSIRCSLKPSAKPQERGNLMRWGKTLTRNDQTQTPAHFSYRTARHTPAIRVYERMLGSTEGHKGLKQTRQSMWYSSTKHIHWKKLCRIARFSHIMTKKWQVMLWIKVTFWCKKTEVFSCKIFYTLIISNNKSLFIVIPDQHADSASIWMIIIIKSNFTVIFHLKTWTLIHSGKQLLYFLWVSDKH